MAGRLAGWPLALRLARRDAWRARGRSALVLVMIGLPVMAVVAAAVTFATSEVRGSEGIDRRMGAAQAVVTVQPGVGRVFQGPDPDVGGFGSDGTGADGGVLDAAGVSRELDGARLLELRSSSVRLTTDDGVAQADLTETDLQDPLADGLFRLVSGRWPDAGEVVVNQAVLDQGYAVGDRLRLADDDATGPTVVGVAESTTVRAFPVVAGPPGVVPVSGSEGDETATWLVGGGPVTWSDVRRLNELGAAVASRAVLLDPPPASEVPPEARSTGEVDPTTVAVLGLVVAMVLLEVVLLAGPAFAVGARRQARSLALVVASGGTPRQARRVVLAGAVVLGGVASLVGAVAGLGLSVLVLPVLQRFSTTWFGPFDVPWLLVAGVAGLGLVSALLAALVPAVLASRQDVVAVLAGRRGEPRPSRRSPVLGVVLLLVGVAAASVGALDAGRELFIAAGGLVSVLGMVLLVPLVLSLLGRGAGRLPLVLRYAVRDAARQRTRTAPAVAAVAATVAGVVAIGIGASSDARQNEATYQPTLVAGAAALTVGALEPDDVGRTDWSAVRAIAERFAPGATIETVRGVTSPDSYTEITGPDPGQPLLSSYGSPLGADVLVGTAGLDAVPGLDRAARATIDDALSDGRAAVLVDELPRVDGADPQVTVTITDYDPQTGEEQQRLRQRAPATFVAVPSGYGGAQAVLPESLARELGQPVRPVGVTVTGATITPEQEEAMTEAMAALSPYASVIVERGFQGEEETLIVLLVLGALGAVLALGGTLTATFLSLSDARPDLATLAAVGASPTTRRGIAAAYALVVGGVGAVLGALVGFVPGLAIAVPLTSGDIGQGPSGPYLDVPWLLVLALVVVLPLATAALVALTTRSRLPLVARAA